MVNFNADILEIPYEVFKINDPMKMLTVKDVVTLDLIQVLCGT